jgi:hypothetical protein
MILELGKNLKTKIRNAVGLLSSGVKECSAMTPFVANFELNRVKLRLGQYCDSLKKTWFFYLYADKELLEQYIQGLFENLENTPNINFEFVTVYSPSEKEEGPTDVYLDSNEITELDDNEDKHMSTDYLDLQDNKTFNTKEEEDIMNFLMKHPEIEKLRQDKMNKLFKDLEDKEVKSVKYFINEKGKLAKLIKFEGENENYMIRKDENGNKVISQKLNNGWFQVDKSYVSNGTDAAKIFAGRSFNVKLPTPDIGGSLMMSGTGAIGNFLFKLVEGKDEVQEISQKFVKDAGSSAALTVIMTTMPFVGLSIASVVGAKAINDLRKNKYIKPSKKVTIISEILARTGAKAALTIGGAAIGQTLIPIPFLGAFVGGVIGGFTASAVETSYDSLVAKRVSLELFCFFCLVKIKKRGKWAREKLFQDDIPNLDTELDTFLEVINTASKENIKKNEFKVQLLDKKQDDIFELMDDMFACIADKDKGETIDQVFEQKWKSMILYCFVSYYYFLLCNQLDGLQAEKKLEEEEKLNILARFECLLYARVLVEWLAPQLSIFGQWKPYERFIIVLNDMIKDCKIVTLFKKLDSVDKDGQAAQIPEPQKNPQAEKPAQEPQTAEKS